MEVVIVVSEHGGRSRLFTGMKTEDWGFDVVTEVKKVSGKETWRGGRQARSVATAAAKSLQSCPTLCDPRDGSPPGSPVLGVLQARTLEWVAISFSNA